MGVVHQAVKNLVTGRADKGTSRRGGSGEPSLLERTGRRLNFALPLERLHPMDFAQPVAATPSRKHRHRSNQQRFTNLLN